MDENERRTLMAANVSQSNQVPPPVLRADVRVHVGTHSPTKWLEVEDNQAKAGSEASEWLRDQRRPRFAADSVDWTAYGLRPCWVGDETTECVAALNPNPVTSQGLREYERFASGARARDETALCVAVVDFEYDVSGQPQRSGRSHSIFGTEVVSVPLIGHSGAVSATRLGHGATMRIAEGLSDTDQDLAVRLSSCTDKLSLAALELYGYQVRTNSYERPEQIEPDGHLEPILLASSGEPVAAVWTSDDGTERMYVLPHGTPVSQVLGWLSERAIPELNPAAMRRALDPTALAAAHPTSEETLLATRLADLDATYEAERASMARAYDTARAKADPIRRNLLYGTGADLENAVANVLEDAGIEVIRLDDTLGATKSADLLVRMNGRSRLVEVKSCKNNAPETIHDRFLSHLNRWPSDAGIQFGPVDGGVLIVNHELRTDPANRSNQPFTRAELMASSPHPITGTIPLLNLWLHSDWPAIQALIFAGELPGETANATPNPVASPFEESDDLQRDTYPGAQQEPSDEPERARGLWQLLKGRRA